MEYYISGHKKENGIIKSLFTTIETVHGSTGSASPWELDWFNEHNYTMFITSDMCYYVRIDGEDIYKFNGTCYFEDIANLFKELQSRHDMDWDDKITLIKYVLNEHFTKVTPDPIGFIKHNITFSIKKHIKDYIKEHKLDDIENINAHINDTIKEITI